MIFVNFFSYNLEASKGHSSKNKQKKAHNSLITSSKASVYDYLPNTHYKEIEY